MFQMKYERNMLSIHIIVVIVIVVVVIVVVIIVVIVVVVDNIDDLDCHRSKGLDKDKEGKDGEGLLALWLVTTVASSVSGRQVGVDDTDDYHDYGNYADDDDIKNDSVSTL